MREESKTYIRKKGPSMLRAVLHGSDSSGRARNHPPKDNTSSPPQISRKTSPKGLKPWKIRCKKDHKRRGAALRLDTFGSG